MQDNAKARTEYYPGPDGERVEAIEKVHELLHRPRSSADFSPAARYAVSALLDYAARSDCARAGSSATISAWRTGRGCTTRSISAGTARSSPQ